MKIKGKIVDEFGMPLAGSHVTKFGNALIGTYTDSDGKFELENDTIKSFDIFKITYVGYGDQLRNVSELEKNPTIELKYEDIELPEFVGTPKTIENSNAPTGKQNFWTNNKKPIIIITAIASIVGGFFLIKKVI